jgi:predicted nucleic acid-binding protein
LKYVLDASVALAWYLPDEGDAYTRALFDHLESASITVPSIWPIEVANALLVVERRRRALGPDLDDFASALATLPIEIARDAELQAFGSWLGLGRKYGVTTYDAAYLAVALRLGLPLATIDSRLRSAADSAGIGVA